MQNAISVVVFSRFLIPNIRQHIKCKPICKGLQDRGDQCPSPILLKTSRPQSTLLHLTHRCERVGRRDEFIGAEMNAINQSEI